MIKTNQWVANIATSLILLHSIVHAIIILRTVFLPNSDITGLSTVMNIFLAPLVIFCLTIVFGAVAAMIAITMIANFQSNRFKKQFEEKEVDLFVKSTKTISVLEIALGVLMNIFSLCCQSFAGYVLSIVVVFFGIKINMERKLLVSSGDSCNTQ